MARTRCSPRSLDTKSSGHSWHTQRSLCGQISVTVPIRRPSLPRGCSTNLLDIICGDLLFASILEAAGWPVSSPLCLPTHLRPKDTSHRIILDERIKVDGPFCLVLDFGDWDDNHVTTWMAETVSTRVQRESCHSPLGK